MFPSVKGVYDLTDEAIRLCHEQGNQDVADELHNALNLGSSPLEILGAIRATFVQNTNMLGRMIGPDAVANVVSFVDKAYGR